MVEKRGVDGKPAANAYTAGKWQHVALCVDGTKNGTEANTVTASLYVDGRLVSSGNVASGIMSNKDSALYFGLNAWDAYYTGALDDVMVLNRALSQSEVQVIAAGEANTANGGVIGK